MVQTAGYGSLRQPSELTSYDGAVIFDAWAGTVGGLWRSDGTTEGTVLLKQLRLVTDLVVANETLLFRATDAVHGVELWKSDGTPEGTVLVADIMPGPLDSRYPLYDGNFDFYYEHESDEPNAMLPAGKRLFLPADDGRHGIELWQTYVNRPPASAPSAPASIGEGQSFAVEAGTSSDPDGTIVSYEWDLDYDGSTFDVDATGPSAGAVAGDGPAGRVVALRVTDDDGMSSIGTATIDITNTAPAATFAGGAVTEGAAGVVTFTAAGDASAADVAAGFLYSYDFDNDGVFEIVDSGDASAAVPASYLADGPAVREVRGRVADKDGGFSDYTAMIDVRNAAPSMRVEGPTTGKKKTELAFTLFANDPSPLDQAAGFTWSVDWDGDGGIDQLLSGPSGLSTTWSYREKGVYTITAIATDKDGDSAVTTHVITID